MTGRGGGLASESGLAATGGVLIVRSEQTDARGLLECLRRRGLAYEDLVLHMEDAAQRNQYEDLRRRTGWQTLPMVFVDGHLLGGEQELRQSTVAAATTTGGSSGRLKAMTLLSSLGYLSAVPFLLALAALLVLAGPQAAMVEDLLIGYGAVILSFLGAVHWGRILDAEAESRVSVVAGLLAVMPAMVGWGSLLLPTQLALPLQAALFVGIYAVDRVALASLPLGGWYVRLRNRLTAIVVAVLLAAWLAVTL